MTKVVDQLEITVIGTKKDGSQKAVIKYSCSDDAYPDLKGPSKTISMNMATFVGASGGAIGQKAASSFWFAVLNAAEYTEGIAISAPAMFPDWPSGAAITITNKLQHTLTLNWPMPFTGYTVDSFQIFQKGVLIATVPGNTTSFNVAGLEKATQYYFQVQASEMHSGVLYWTSDGPVVVVDTAE